MSGVLSVLFFQNQKSGTGIEDQSRHLDSINFDLISLNRTVHASFLSLVSPPLLSPSPGALKSFQDGMAIQARAVLSDLSSRKGDLASSEQTSLTGIRSESERFFSRLGEKAFSGPGPLPPGLAAIYRPLTFHISSLSYHIEARLQKSAHQLEELYRTRSRLVIFEVLLILLYALAVIAFATSRRHTKQVLLDFAAEESADIIAITDGNGRILFHNRSFRRLFSGTRTEGCEGESLSSLFSTTASFDLAGREWEEFLGHSEKERKFVLPLRNPALPQISWLMVQMTPTHFRGRPVYLEWKATDISRIKNAELALEAQGEWLRTTLASIGDGVIATDIDGRINFMNQVAERLTGYSANEALGKPVDEIFRIINEKSGEPVEVPIQKVLKNDIVVGLANHTALIDRRGKIVSISDSAAPIHDKAGLLTGVVMVFQENTERRKAQEMIWNLTYHDSLTRLPNRSLFEDRLATLIPWARDNHRMLGVLMLDIDQFKRVNDSLGHGAGNELLKEFSERLSAQIFSNDTLARIGGDEFLVMLTGCQNEKDVSLACEKILRSFAAPFPVAGQEIALSASIGIALFPRDGSNPEELIKNADNALNAAKEGGRNRFYFFEEIMSSGSLRDLQMEQALKQGLLRGEFFLEFQPQVDTASGRIAGTEALVRWNHPERGRVLPGEFIPLAEKTGLVIPLGSSVLRMAAEQVRQWWADGHRISVSVNISYQHFVRPDFIDEIAGLIQNTGVPPKALILEITESMVIKNSEVFFAIVEKLFHEGVRISIDDFGTGATALSYLTAFPISEVKIDRSFVTHLFSDLKRAELVRTIIGLGKRLDFLTVAEGVENPEEWDYLEKHHCDRIQGYFASYPLSPEDLAALIGRRFLRRPSGEFAWVEP